MESRVYEIYCISSQFKTSNEKAVLWVSFHARSCLPRKTPLPEAMRMHMCVCSIPTAVSVDFSRLINKTKNNGMMEQVCRLWHRY